MGGVPSVSKNWKFDDTELREYLATEVEKVMRGNKLLPWHNQLLRPFNAVKLNNYAGSNRWRLGLGGVMRGYNCNQWAAEKQIGAGQLLPDAEAFGVLYFQPTKRLNKKTGKEEDSSLWKWSMAYNLTQTKLPHIPTHQAPFASAVQQQDAYIAVKAAAQKIPEYTKENEACQALVVELATAEYLNDKGFLPLPIESHRTYLLVWIEILRKKQSNGGETNLTFWMLSSLSSKIRIALPPL